MTGGLWGLLTILGPILLAAVLLWAILKNRKASPRDEAQTEAATRELYQTQDAVDKAMDEKVQR